MDCQQGLPTNQFSACIPSYHGARTLKTTNQKLTLRKSGHFMLGLYFIHCHYSGTILRPGHTGPDNENEDENDKNARPRLVE